MNELLVLGSPTGERVQAFQASLQRAGLTPARVLSYRTLWEGDATAEQWVQPGSIVRFESPSDEPGLDDLLLRLGGANGRSHDTDVYSSHSWMLGLRKLLRRVDDWLLQAPPHRRTHRSDDIETMLDKHATWARLRAAGVPVPDALPAADRSWDELRRAAEARGWSQCLVKARYGSSAAGLLAVRWSRERVHGLSTVALAPNAPAFNSRALRSYRTATELDAVLAAIGPAHVERWLPKIGLPGAHGTARPTDFRVVVIDRQAQHLLVRVGRGPFTNLHLGADRGDPDQVRSWLGEQTWQGAQQAAEEAVRCFPEALFAGVDVGVVQPGHEVVIWEVNAFGDFHEGIEVDGKDTYQAELAALGVHLPRSGAGPAPTWPSAVAAAS